MVAVFNINISLVVSSRLGSFSTVLCAGIFLIILGILFILYSTALLHGSGNHLTYSPFAASTSEWTAVTAFTELAAVSASAR
jgi:hypothetical protein